MFRLTSGLPMQTAMWRLYVRPKGTGNRWDSEGPPGDRQGPPGAGLQRLQSLQRRWGFIIVHSVINQLSDVLRFIDFPIYKITKEKQLGQIPGASSH